MVETPSGRGRVSEYDGIPVLVTGATGFIGRWVCRLLSEERADLKLAARDASALGTVCRAYGIRGTPVIVDLRRTGAARTMLEAHHPAITFNLAGYGVHPAERDGSEMARINEELPEEIAEGMARLTPDHRWNGLRVVHTGSAVEYGRLEGPISERHQPAACTPYGRSKLEGTRRIERVSERRGVPCCTARLATVYGPGEPAHRLLPSLLRAADRGEPVALSPGLQERDFTYVGDVARGLLMLGALPGWPGGVVNLATGELTSVRGFVERTISVLGLRPEQARFGALPARDDEVRQGPLDVELLRELVGWQPGTGIAEGVRQTRAFVGQEVDA